MLCRTTAATCFAALVALFLTAAPLASASAQAPTYVSSFGSLGSGNGQFRAPVGIAADPNTGDLWVADNQNARIEEFSPAGEFIRTVQTSAPGTDPPYGIAVDPQSRVWEVNVSGKVQEFTPTGELIRSFGKGGWGPNVGPGEFNVAESIALDSKGDVYVTDRGNHRIQEFTGTGEYIRSLSRPKENNESNAGPADAAIDAAGDLWVSYSLESKIVEFNTATGSVMREWGAAGSGPGQLKYADRLAVGPDGNIWVSEFGNDRVQVFTPGGELLYAFGSHGTGPGQFIGPRGIAFVGAALYAVDGGEASLTNPRIERWTTVQPPVATTEAATGIDADEADLQATVNPGGAETKYQFEYGTTTSYGSRVPLSSKSIGSGTEPVNVSEVASGLKEDTTYHYRITAENAGGMTYGSDQIFTTEKLPEATTEAATGVEANEAILRATVDPNGSETIYTFEYGPTTGYGSVGPATEEELAAGSEPVEVIAAPEHLEPETLYHYRVVATSDAGTSFGEDRTFTTSAASITPHEEEERESEELAFTGATLAHPLPEDFVDMMWSGDPSIEAKPAEMKVIEQSGAKWLRFEMSWLIYKEECAKKGCWEELNKVMENATLDGIRILPNLDYGRGQDFPVSQEELTHWNSFAEGAYNRYGPGGTFWTEFASKHPGVPLLPVQFWEVGNENNYGKWDLNEVVDPEQFGGFLSDTHNALMHAAGGGEVNVILGGLLSLGEAKTKPLNGQEVHTQLRPEEFLKRMHQGRNAFMALGLHPYAFQAKGGGAPKSPEVKQITHKVRENVAEAREALREIGLNSDKIWITELGWPVEDGHVEEEDKLHVRVTPMVQRELLTKTFEMLMAKSEEYKIRNVFYYNDVDLNLNEWAYNCGLRSVEGKFRPAWYGFEHEAKHAENYPYKPSIKKNGHHRHPKRLEIFSKVNPKNLPTEVQVEYGEHPGALTSVTSPQPVGWEENEDEIVSEITGLQPDHPYFYVVVAKNANGEVEKTEEEELRTLPSTETNVGFRTLNGEPGWISLWGSVEAEHTINPPDYVNVNLWKKEAGEFKFDQEKSTHLNVEGGSYRLENLSLGHGEWQMQVVFPGFGEDERSETKMHTFTVKNGYQLVAMHSGKCLEVAEDSPSNGASIHQEQCGDPSNRFDQVFSLVPAPTGANRYEIVDRNSGKCLDVREASQENGAGIQQYECLGWGHPNQIFEGVPFSEGASEPVRFIATHSGKCFDVAGGSTSDGALLQQWECGSGSNQAFRFESVESNQVPVGASITVDKSETLNGEPGYVSFHGNITAAYDLSGKEVNVNFERETSPGQYTPEPQLTAHLALSSSGHFEYKFWGIGHDNWQTRVVFVGQGPLAEEKSEYRTFSIGSGYRFKFRQSEMCLTTNNEKKENGTLLIQWPCVSTVPSGGQVYSVVPMSPPGSNYFQIQPNSVTWAEKQENKTKCLDVTGGPGATGDGPAIQLWKCLGPEQTNQIFHIVELASPNKGWFAFVAKNSNKCVTVSENSMRAATQFLQWGGGPNGECAWAGSQQWEWQGIG